MDSTDLALLRRIAAGRAFTGESTDPAFQATVRRLYDLMARGYIEMLPGHVKRSTSADRGFIAAAPTITDQGQGALLEADMR